MGLQRQVSAFDGKRLTKPLRGVIRKLMYPFGGIGILKNSDSLKHSFHVENVSCIGPS